MNQPWKLDLIPDSNAEPRARAASALPHWLFLIGPEPAFDTARSAAHQRGLRVRQFATPYEFGPASARLPSGAVLMDADQAGIDAAVVADIARRKAVRFLLLQTSEANLPAMVRAVRSGAADILLTPYDDREFLSSFDTAQRLIEQQSSAETDATAFDRLSDRERDVLKGLARGLSNKSIAADLGISHRTVEIHRAHLMRKLGAKSLSDVLAFAFSHRDRLHLPPSRKLTLAGAR